MNHIKCVQFVWYSQIICGVCSRKLSGLRMLTFYGSLLSSQNWPESANVNGPGACVEKERVGGRKDCEQEMNENFVRTKSFIVMEEMIATLVIQIWSTRTILGLCWQCTLCTLLSTHGHANMLKQFRIILQILVEREVGKLICALEERCFAVIL